MFRTQVLRSILRAAALALPLAGLAAPEAVRAMPAAPLAPAFDRGGVVAVQYQRYPGYRYRRFNRHRRAGLYRCGPGGLSTHLERRACR